MEMSDIDARIAELKAQLEKPAQETEIYTRITGYYRSLDSWNPGKREEYRQRQVFTTDGKPTHHDGEKQRTTFRPDQKGALPIVGQFAALSLGNDDDWDLGERDEAANQYETCESCQ